MIKEQVTDYGEHGEPQMTVDEHPVNLPLSRLDRDVSKRLKELGIYDDPESEKADATKSLAEALSGSDD
jgi:hypothetical protein